MTPTASEFVEIYETDSQAEAARIVEVVLGAEGVEAIVHDRIDHAIPAPASQSGSYFVAVPVAERDRAVALLDDYLEALESSPGKS